MQSATTALRALAKGEKKYFKDVAEAMKRDLDEKAGEGDEAFAGTWHCVVGKSFGSFCTHEAAGILQFYLGAVAFLAFRHG